MWAPESKTQCANQSGKQRGSSSEHAEAMERQSAGKRGRRGANWEGGKFNLNGESAGFEKREYQTAKFWEGRDNKREDVKAVIRIKAAEVW